MWEIVYWLEKSDKYQLCCSGGGVGQQDREGSSAAAKAAPLLRLLQRTLCTLHCCNTLHSLHCCSTMHCVALCCSTIQPTLLLLCLADSPKHCSQKPPCEMPLAAANCHCRAAAAVHALLHCVQEVLHCCAPAAAPDCSSSATLFPFCRLHWTRAGALMLWCKTDAGAKLMLVQN